MKYSACVDANLVAMRKADFKVSECGADYTKPEPNQSKIPPEQCPSPWRGMTSPPGKSPRWGFFDKVAMPILFPDQYGQPAIDSSLSLDAKLWLIMQAKLESENEPDRNWNIFNNQYDANTPIAGSKTVPRSEYACDSPPSTPITIPKGWAASTQRNGVTKYLCLKTVRVITASGPVEAVNNDLSFLKQKSPSTYNALRAGTDVDTWIGTLGGYGTSPKYRDKAGLRSEIGQIARDLDAYLARRDEVMDDADECAGKQASTDVQRVTLKAARAAAGSLGAKYPPAVRKTPAK